MSVVNKLKELSTLTLPAPPPAPAERSTAPQGSGSATPARTDPAVEQFLDTLETAKRMSLL